MWCLLFLLTSWLSVSRSDDMSCRQRMAECEKDLDCVGALHNIFVKECRPALGYDPNWKRIEAAMQIPCPLTCVYAIKNLTALPKGRAWENCKCMNGDPICLTVKARLQRCTDSRRANYSIFSCTEARERCEANADCLQVQNDFLNRCSHLISGIACTQDCKESQDRLLGLELGKALNDCECDGMEEPFCRGIRAHYEALCKSPRDPRDPNVLPTTSTTDRLVMERSSGRLTVDRLYMWTVYSAIVGNIYLVFIR